jgi:spore coat polysaccharide biosynthesis protein SpsF
MSAVSPIVAIVQARMSSTRLPGKVLADVAGKPMILRQLDRLSRCTSLDAIVVATSVDSSDDELVKVVEGAGYRVVRGSLDDVLDRFLAAVDATGASTVVRITADCPLHSPAVIDAVVTAFVSSGADYASNTMDPTYPDGVDCEVVRADVLREVAAFSVDSAEREHVTLGVYRHPERFSIHSVKGERDLSDLRWTVDTPEDLVFVREVFARLLPEPFELDDVLALLEAEPSLSRTSADSKRNAALDGIDTGVMRHEP